MGVAETVRELWGGEETPMQRAEAWASRIVDRLDAIHGAVAGGEEREQRISRAFTIATDANGNGQVEVAFPPGVAWNLLKLTGGGNTTGYVALFLDVADDVTRLIEVVPTATLYSEALTPDGDYIGEHSTLIVAARGQAANSNVGGRITAKAIIRKAKVEDAAPVVAYEPEEEPAEDDRG